MVIVALLLLRRSETDFCLILIWRPYDSGYTTCLSHSRGECERRVILNASIFCDFLRRSSLERHISEPPFLLQTPKSSSKKGGLREMLPVGTKSPEMKLRPQRDGASTAVYAATGRSKIWGMRGTGAGHGSQCLTDPELLMVFCARDPLLNFGTSHYLNTSHISCSVRHSLSAVYYQKLLFKSRRRKKCYNLKIQNSMKT